jgi:hypothetical protein
MSPCFPSSSPSSSLSHHTFLHHPPPLAGLSDVCALASDARLGMICTLLQGPPQTDLEATWAPMLASHLLRGGLEATSSAVGTGDDAPSGDPLSTSGATVSSDRNMQLVRCIVEEASGVAPDPPSAGDRDEGTGSAWRAAMHARRW